jgi:hypothetical protein
MRRASLRVSQSAAYPAMRWRFDSALALSTNRHGHDATTNTRGNAMKSTVTGQLNDSLREIVCMYGPALRNRNMRDALKRAGVRIPAAVNGGGCHDENGALAFLVRQELHRRDKRLADARARRLRRKTTLFAKAD